MGGWRSAPQRLTDWEKDTSSGDGRREIVYAVRRVSPVFSCSGRMRVSPIHFAVILPLRGELTT